MLRAGALLRAVGLRVFFCGSLSADTAESVLFVLKNTRKPDENSG